MTPARRLQWEAETRAELKLLLETRHRIEPRIRLLEEILRVQFTWEGGMAKRKYKSGTAWCVWRWTDVDSEYITRLHVLKTPWFAICLHWIRKPDPEPYLHDHPVTFLSVILRGGYSEIRARPIGDGWTLSRHQTHRRFNFVRASADDRHSITEVEPSTLTLCLMGPKRREWGFHRPSGWIGWKAYYAEKREAAIG